MNFFNFPIKRPVTIAMGMVMVLILGALSLQRMPLDLMPEISFPNLSVAVRYEGAGPEEVEERVGKVLEASIKTTANIKNVKVTAQEELCFVNAEFNWGTDLDEASADLREKIAMVRDVLPEEIDEPVVIRINLQEFPVMFMNVSDNSGTRSLADLADIGRDEIAPKLERLSGVASAAVLGGLSREIQVNCDKEKLDQYNLSLTDIVNAIRYRNLDLTTGHVDQASLRFRIKGKSQFNSIEELENIIVGYGLTQGDRQSISMRALIPYKDPLAGTGAKSPIRLRDVAQVLDTYKEKRGMVRIVNRRDEDGDVFDALKRAEEQKKWVGSLPGFQAAEGIGMAVMKETDANMVEVADVVMKELDAIRQDLPGGVDLTISFDLSEIIRDSIGALTNSAIEGGVLAALVIFVFLWQIRPSIIVITSIPLSLFVAFMAMYFSDYTLNIMTLGGMVIAVGKLVDDSIVVLENIYRHIADGEDPEIAAERGFREVATAVTSATLVAVIIFLPVAFTEGLSAQLFRTFAGTVFFALMASLVISFTVIPMLSSKLLRTSNWGRDESGKEQGGSFGRAFARAKHRHEKIWNRVENGYGKVVTWAVDSWGQVLALAAIISVLTVILIGLMAVQGKYEFVPRLVGNMYRATVELAPGTLMEETAEVMNEVSDRMIENTPDLRSLFMVVGESGDPGRAAFTGGEQGMNQGEMNIRTYKQAERDYLGVRPSTDEELRAIWDDFALDNPNVEISFMQAGSLDFSSEKPIQVKIFGDDFGILRKISDDIADLVEEVEGVRDVTTSMEEGVPEYNYTFRKEKLGRYLMPSGMVLSEVRTALGGQLASLYREAGKEYDITVQLIEHQRDSFEDIGNVKVMAPMGFPVYLRDIAEFEFDEGPLMIKRENSKRLVSVGANKTENSSLGEISQKINEVIDGYPVPEGYLVEFGGEIEDLGDAFTDLALMFVASLILVYLILASLYESLIHPITIMIAIPLAFTGAVAALYLTGTAFGVTAFIGMIMLVGIVATNSIVLMDFILEFHREKGMERREAIIEAGRTRLRPILMTAMTTMFGVLPIALGRAEGMELQQPLGIVMVGGLVTSTILTLIIIPVMYQIFDDFIIDMKDLLGGKNRRQKKKAISERGMKDPKSAPSEDDKNEE